MTISDDPDKLSDGPPAGSVKSEAGEGSTLQIKQQYEEPETPALSEMNAERETPMADAANSDNSKMLNEIQRVVAALRSGQLSARGNTSGLSPDCAELISGVNAILDTVASPFNELSIRLEVLASGAVPEKITTKYHGEFDVIKNNFNSSIESLKMLMAQLRHMSKEHDNGDIDIVINEDKFHNDFAKVAQDINSMVQGHIAVKKKAMACIAEFGKGNFDAPLEKFPGKKAFINDTVEQVRINLKSLMTEVDRIISASVDGRLDFRADASKHQGDFGKILQGINSALDAILLPIGEGNRVLTLIRGGNLRQRVEIQCKGDHQKMKDAVNGVHAWLEALIAYVRGIANGDLTVQMAKASQDDQIHEWLMLLKNNISALVADANLLAEAAVAGRLATRADATKHQGDYRKIVEGVNNTLDSVIGPLNVAANYVDQIAKGDIPRENHRQLQRRLQRPQEQPQHVHRRHQPAGRRRPGHRRRRSVGEDQRPLGKRRRRQEPGQGHRGVAGSPEGTAALDRRFQGRPAFRARQSGAVPGRLRRSAVWRERHAGRHPRPHRRRQSRVAA